MNNLFSESNEFYFLSLLLTENQSVFITSEFNSNDWVSNVLTYLSLIGIFMAILNYIIIPFVMKNYRFKYFKIFILYEKYFLNFYKL